MEKILEKSGNFVSPEKWEPCYIAPGWDESLEKYITVYVYDNVIVSCS